MPLLGFSPRKARLTIYFSEGFDRYRDQLAVLGKHSSSVSCLYATKLADLDLDVLREMLVSSHRLYAGQDEKPATVAEYVERVPAASRPLFDEIRALVRAELPDAEEVLSYGLVGYRLGRRRAVVYVGGWNSHVSLYPVPKDAGLRRELEPYLHGAGTIRLSLDSAPPHALLRRAVAYLAANP